MGVGVGFGIEDACMVYTVYPDLAKGMDNIVVLHYDSYMIYNAIVVVKKG